MAVNGITLRLNQTIALLYKNLIHVGRNPIGTITRLIIPAIILTGFVALNIVLRNSLIRESDAYSAKNPKHERHPPSFKTPSNLPASDSSSITMFFCSASNPLHYTIAKSMAEMNDPPLSIIDFQKGFENYTDWIKCKHDICGFNSCTEMEYFQNEIIISNIKPAKLVNSLLFFSGDINSLEYHIGYNSTFIPKNPLTGIGGVLGPHNYELQILKLLQSSLIRLGQDSNLTTDSLSKYISSQHPPPSFNYGNNLVKPTIDISSVAFPWVNNGHYQNNPIKRDPATGPLLILFLCTCAYFIAIFCHYTLNNERDAQLRQSMKMMGLTDFSYWFSWIITWTIYNAIACVFILVVGYSSKLDMFMNTNPIVIYLALFLYAESLIFSFMWISTFIRSNALTNICSFVTLVCILAFSLLFADFEGITSQYPNPSTGVIINNLNFLAFLNAIPTYNFGMVMSDVYFASASVLNSTSGKWQPGRGYYFSDMFNKNLYREVLETFDNGEYRGMETPEILPAALSLLFLALSCPVFMILTWIFDNILPSSNGIRRSIFFMFSPDYWGVQSDKSTKNTLAVDVSLHSSSNYSSVLPDTDQDIYQEYQNVIKSLDQDPNHTQYPIKIVKLSKTYTKLLSTSSTRSKNALDNLTLMGERDQTLVILGHNGAGKSSMLNMLTGLQAPTAGDALIYGDSIVNNIDSVRRSIGVCPQHDCIWEELTGYQHMLLYALIKGVSLKQVGQVIQNSLNKVLLWPYRNQIARTYSGGMKRRLTVAMSILGDPKLLLMDEPTAGMDPDIRRKIWTLITELKKDRVIILTTHSMEEAEALGDKIAILALGRLRAVGSTSHLKARFGAGYSLDLMCKEENVQELKEKVQSICPHSVLETETAGTLSYTLPPRITREVTRLFQFIETEASKKNSLFTDWLLSHTTLEEVFLRLTHGGTEGVFEASNSAMKHGENRALQFDLEGLKINPVNINKETTLADVRQELERVNDSLRNIHYLFMNSTGALIPRNHEPFSFANAYLPIIEMQQVEEQETLDVETQIKMLKETIQNMSQENEYLKNLVTQLQHQLNMVNNGSVQQK